jgi:hypothetical protein
MGVGRHNTENAFDIRDGDGDDIEMVDLSDESENRTKAFVLDGNSNKMAIENDDYNNDLRKSKVRDSK